MVSDKCPQSHHFTQFSGENTQFHDREPTPLDREDWDALPYDDRLPFILAFEDPAEWFERYALDVLTGFRTVPWEWGKIKAMAKQRGVNVWDLEKAVDALLAVMKAEAQTSGASTASAPSPTERPRFHPITATDLYAKDLPPLAYVVDDILPIGATLFAGRAKDGKSLAMWNLCMAVAEGGLAFGRYRATPGDVLYLALEDGERRAKKRLTDQMQAMNMTMPPDRLSLVLWEAPRLGEGLEKALTAWLDAHSGAKLIVIDILEKVRHRRSRNGSVYQEDYLAIAPLQRLAQERGIAIVIVHHANKGKAEDFRDGISGSMSLAGAADTLWVLQRLAGEADAAIRITGRDVETLDLALQFRDGFWTALGDREMVTMSRERQGILDVLRASPRPLTPTHVAEQTGKHRVTTTRLLRMLLDAGLVFQPTEGHYALSPTANDRVNPVNSVNSMNPVNSVNAPVPQQAEIGAVHAEFTLSPSCHESSQPVEDTRFGGDSGGRVHRVHGVHDVQVIPDITEDITTATAETPTGQGPYLAASGREYRCERCGTVVGARTATTPATNGHTNGHDTGSAPGRAIACAMCDGISRWNDRGILRCIRCYPPTPPSGA